MNADAAVARARKYLKTASLALREEDYESCVSRAYYAMFYTCPGTTARHRRSDAQRHHQPVQFAFRQDRCATHRDG